MVDVGDIADAAVGADALHELPGKFVKMVRGQGIRSRMYVSRGFGEVASIIAAPVATVVVDKGFSKPYEDMKERFCRAVVEPNLEKFDDFFAHAKSLDPPEDREERHKKPRHEQARQISDYIVDTFGVKFGASVLGQFITQGYFTKLFDAPVGPKNNMLCIAADRGVQFGSMIAFNTVLSKQAIGMQRVLEKAFMKTGVTEDQAEEWANYAVNFSIPNFIAYGASAEMLTQFAKRGKI